MFVKSLPLILLSILIFVIVSYIIKSVLIPNFPKFSPSSNPVNNNVSGSVPERENCQRPCDCSNGRCICDTKCQ